MSQQAADIDQTLERYPGKPEYLIFLLQDIQHDHGYISPQAMDQVCDRTGVPLTQAYSVATFYKSFRLEPQGEHEIKVCSGTACHLKGGERLVDDLKRRLSVSVGGTTKDMRFTLDTVNCVGACSLSPLVLVDEEYKPHMTSLKMDRILKTLEQDISAEPEVRSNA